MIDCMIDCRMPDKFLRTLTLAWGICALFAACSAPAVSQSAQGEDPGAAPFSDLHNSSLHRMFLADDPDGFSKEGFPIDMRSFDVGSPGFQLFSYGMPRFGRDHASDVQIGEAIGFLRLFRQRLEEAHPQVAFAGDGRSLAQAMEQGKTAWAFAWEDAWLLRGDVRWLDSLYAVGVRSLQPGHRFLNEFFQDSSPRRVRGPAFLGPETEFSPLGMELLERMRDMGMRIDAAHLPEAAFWQLVRWNAGQVPLIVSHTGARTICDVERNLSDEQAKAIAGTGGLIGICFHGPLIRPGGKEARIKDLVRHIAYLVDLVGEEHVALGSDWEGLIRPVRGMETWKGLEKLRREMRRQGLSERAIERVVWRNALRFYSPGLPR